MNKTNLTKISKVCKSLISSSRNPRWNPKLSRNAHKVLRGDYIIPKATSKVPWVSVEIECFFKNIAFTWDILATAFDKVGLSDFVRLHDDGSIEAYNHKGECYPSAEVVVTAPESKVLKVLEEVCCVLQSLNAHTNDTCGLHIHIDHRPQIKRSPIVSYNNLYYAEDLLFKVSKPYRRECEFCEPICSDNVFQSLRDSCGEYRYRSINTEAMDTNKTLEIRTFHSTINFKEVKHFLNLVLGVVNCNTPLNNRLNAKNLDTCKSIPLPTRRFIKSKYSSPRRKVA